MTKSQTDRQHLMTARLRQELAVAEALRRLNQYRDAAGWKQHRTPSQTETLSSLPPITAFMGMGG
ncbi:hypothetical protein GR138_12950 [Shinella kummerowiae]|uniref:Uncharacterized protein n=1 Tax=Shinella kummerowiae TaxID=417745 RepID=A0A6N8SAY9_9HYPH|nr:hypothetical protein [Shinella kummerowiae]MXN46099.1 hypothetical protein [Shinella kummerowiae]